MPFTLPTFNVLVNIWHQIPPNFLTNPPDVITPGNIAWGKRVNPGSISPTGSIAYAIEMVLLLPKGTDVRSPAKGWATNNVVEVPATSKRTYIVLDWDDIGYGFDNEHRAALIKPLTLGGAWPSPMPGS